MTSTQLPTISIIVPSFNQAQYLGEALDSVFRQEYPCLEVLVMDGGSTDGSLDVIRAYESRLTYWQSGPDGGQAAAVNEGVTRSSGELVAWLNSDDLYWNAALWTVADAYVTNPGFGLYIGNGFRFNQESREYIPFCPHHVAFNRQALKEGLDFIQQPSAFFGRRAWQDVAGLNPNLHYCMDWDILIRIADRYPVVTINEFLSVSREHGDTKTRTGKLSRASEICRVARIHTGREMTPGAVYYLMETLLGVVDDHFPAELRPILYSAMQVTTPLLTGEPGNNSCFPFYQDAQDRMYLPFARASSVRAPVAPTPHPPPTISVITPSYNQARYLAQTLDSILNQEYPNVESIVIDGGSTDGSIDVLKSYENRLKYWVSEPDRGPAHAINKGFARAEGEIVAWVNSDDVLAQGALAVVAQEFSRDPELDLVYANALYIDENNQLFLADHGTHKTGLYYGKMQPLHMVPAYWAYVHAIPQPTVFFRRRLLDSCGLLDESYHFIFDFEFFFRVMWKAKAKKIERTQAFYRIHAAAKTSDWNKFLVELYRFSRGWWPRRRTAAFQHTLRDFVTSYMRRRFPGTQRDLRYWMAAAAVALSAITKVGNPEAMQFRFVRKATVDQNVPKPDLQLPARFPAPPLRAPAIDRTRLRYRSIFCSFLWPKHPGRSGGEIRDFYLLRHLLSMSRVDFVALYESAARDDRPDYLRQHVESLQTPSSIQAAHPDVIQADALTPQVFTRLADWARQHQLPVAGFRYHWDAAVRFPVIQTYAAKRLEEMVETDRPDFLFVSPQANPVALTLDASTSDTRLVMASYDVESVRMRRMIAALPPRARIAARLEARRARVFERDNLAHYDGVIAVSELDKRTFEEEYGIDSARVLVIENGVDPEYFQFIGRNNTAGRHVVFVGNFGYLPNHQAGMRLLRDIMPLVRSRIPEVRAWLVGSGANDELKNAARGQYDIVTGQVDDVRPYLALASVACVPLSAGSGTKYKVVEAMSAGVPVVCTSLAAEGLHLEHDRHVMLADSDAEIADAVTALLNDSARGAVLAEAARSYVEQRYSWDANLSRLQPWLETLKQLPRRGTSEAASPPLRRRA